jgi:hypothetical protein
MMTWAKPLELKRKSRIYPQSWLALFTAFDGGFVGAATRAASI